MNKIKLNSNDYIFSMGRVICIKSELVIRSLNGDTISLVYGKDLYTNIIEIEVGEDVCFWYEEKDDCTKVIKEIIKV